MTNAAEKTAALHRLRDQYRNTQTAKSDARREVKEKYDTKMKEEIAAIVRGTEETFARMLSEEKIRYELSVSDIQEHVLRTRNWRMWERWRDLAGVAPEIVKARADREVVRQLNSPFRWSDDFSVLTIVKNPVTDRELNPPLVHDLTTAEIFRTPSGYLMVTADDEAYKASIGAMKNDWLAVVTAELEAVADRLPVDLPERKA